MFPVINIRMVVPTSATFDLPPRGSFPTPSLLPFLLRR
jgi:hypothetical protein